MKPNSQSQRNPLSLLIWKITCPAFTHDFQSVAADFDDYMPIFDTWFTVSSSRHCGSNSQQGSQCPRGHGKLGEIIRSLMIFVLERNRSYVPYAGERCFRAQICLCVCWQRREVGEPATLLPDAPLDWDAAVRFLLFCSGVHSPLTIGFALRDVRFFSG